MTLTPTYTRALAIADSRLALALEIAADPTAHQFMRQGRLLTATEKRAVLFLGACLDEAIEKHTGRAG